MCEGTCTPNLKLYETNDLGHLVFDKVDLVEIAQKYGTPIYVFSEKEIARNFRQIDKAFKSSYHGKVKIAYSVKTNPTLSIIQTISRLGAMFEVSSLGEMYRVKKMDGDLKKVIFTNIYKSKDALQFALENDIGFLAVDSSSDLTRINELAKEFGKEVSILIRANPCIDLKNVIFASGAPWSKTGVPIIEDKKEAQKMGSLKDTAENMFAQSLSMSHVNPVGIHGHLGSQITDVKFYERFSRTLVNFFIDIKEKFGVELDVLDFGGGYPIQYSPDVSVPSIESIAKIITSQVRSAAIRPTLILESGRFIVGNTGVLLTTARTIKTDPFIGKTVVLDACAYNELLDSVLVHWFFNMQVANKANMAKTELVRVVGATNDSLDAFDPLTDKFCSKCGQPISRSRKRLLQTLDEGDIIAIMDVGAYSISLNMNYCTLPRPPIALITNDDRIAIVRGKETLDDVLRGEILKK